MKELNKQLTDKEDEVVEVEDELIKKDQQLKYLREDCDNKLQSHIECIRKLEQNLNENDAYLNHL